MKLRWMPIFVIGFALGAAAGSLGALLLSPSSGAETRRQIRAQLLYLAEGAKIVAERAETAADYLGDQVGRALGGDEEVAWRKVREIREGVARYSGSQQEASAQ
jgi:gas vesicle protein